MNEHTQTTLTTVRAGTLPAALAAILLGSFLLLGVGFAHSSAVHNMAHDGRHAFSVPCH